MPSTLTSGVAVEVSLAVNDIYSKSVPRITYSALMRTEEYVESRTVGGGTDVLVLRLQVVVLEARPLYASFTVAVVCRAWRRCDHQC